MIKHLWDVLDQQIRSIDPTLHHAGLKGSAANVLVPETEDTFKGLVEFMPQCIRVVSAVQS